jgi:hypothetical protein
MDSFLAAFEQKWRTYATELLAPSAFPILPLAINTRKQSSLNVPASEFRPRRHRNHAMRAWSKR